MTTTADQAQQCGEATVTTVAAIPRPAWATDSDHAYGSEIRHDHSVYVDSELMVYMDVCDTFELREDGTAAIVRGEVAICVSYDPVPDDGAQYVKMSVEEARSYHGRGEAQVRELVAAYDTEATA